MKTWHYACIVFMGGCCYGVLSTFVKLAYSAGFSVSAVSGGQYLFGALLSWLLVMFTPKQKLPLKRILQLLGSGIPFGLTGVFYYQSLQTLNASLAIIFLFQFVWIGTFLEWILYKKKPTAGKTISIAVLLIGSVLAANLAAKGGIALSWTGMAWALLSALTFTSFIYLSGSVGKDISPVRKSALLSTGGLLVVFVLLPPTFLLDMSVFMGVAPYGLLLGFFGVVLPPLLFSIGMPNIGPGLGTILAASELPVAVSMSSFLLAEPVSYSQWIGVVLILGGIAAGNVSFSKQAAARRTGRDEPATDRSRPRK
ncbi:DMT family transporter [Paenibacillus flagellatus]|uniref:EamA family transporter n=1 Tax=Paenibacillus flagellatus TaxID=2211139 RepID=A0A2V5JZ26_9BACL|nr:DMT family transporter [Paenibacillus flagellatus]PYI50554.1 EamA family transporter [Paenibacillus flagellatus]